MGAELAGQAAAFGVGGDVEGAGVVFEELVAQRAAPQVDAGFDGDVGPAAGGLRAVVAPAAGREVAAAGRSAVISSGRRDSVFAVAGFGGAEAERERADAVAELGLELEPGGGFVGADVEVLGQVEDRLDGDLGVGVAAPLPDLFGGDRARVSWSRASPPAPRTAACSRWTCSTTSRFRRGRGSCAVCGEVEGAAGRGRGCRPRGRGGRRGTRWNPAGAAGGRPRRPRPPGPGRRPGRRRRRSGPDPRRPTSASAMSKCPASAAASRSASVARGRTGPWPPRSTGPAGPGRSCAPPARHGRPRTPPPRVRGTWCARR